ncbi:hypothetical protein ACFOLG_15295 [Vogesella facilis]|uniref:ATP-grasp domain-containing protein n=1 Tax=Vogesella facilis TaxID=1655232 RepID=A0ABV7RIA4_9NEIS
MAAIVELSCSPAPGHFHGLSQALASLRLQPAALAANPDWPAVDAWLAAAFQLAPCACVAADAVPLASPAVQWSWRVLQLAAQLQRLARLPVFLPGRLLQLQTAAAGGEQVTAAVVQLPQLAADELRRCYQAAAIVLDGFLATPAQFAQPEALHRQLEATLIGPLSRRHPLDYTTFSLLACAHAAKVPWLPLGGGIYQLGWGAQARVLQGAGVERDAMLGIQLGGNKALTRQWLASAGLPVAPQRQLASAADAEQALAELGAPLVIKPAGSVGGQGVTLAVATAAAARAGYAHAAALGAGVLAERQIAGDTHHLQLVDGELLCAVRRRPAGLLADGVHSIRQLLAAENQRRQRELLWQRLPPLPDDALATACLAQQGHDWQAVPAAGSQLWLRPLPSNQEGSQDDDLTAQIHPDNTALACRAVRRLGLSMAGVDILSRDISVSWQQNGAVVLEVNHAPQLGSSALYQRYLPAMLQRLLPGGGRVPLEVFVGDAAALAAARQRQAELAASGVACFVCSDELCLDPQGQPLPLALDGSFARVPALLRQPQLQALLVVLQRDDWLASGLPVAAISRLQWLNDNIASQRGDTPAACGQLRQLLQLHLAADGEQP